MKTSSWSGAGALKCRICTIYKLNMLQCSQVYDMYNLHAKDATVLSSVEYVQFTAKDATVLSSVAYVQFTR